MNRSSARTRCRGSASAICRGYPRSSAEQLITPPFSMVGQPLPDRFERRVAVIIVGERGTRRHLGDIGLRVKGIGVGEGHAQAPR